LKVLPLKTYDFKRKEGVGGTAAATPAPAEAAPAGGVSEGGVIPGGGGLPGSGGGNELKSPNQGISLNRYTEVTTQLRRIPVALVMTVDATAIDDIIGAMSNSRLRFQVTMAPWTRVPNLGRPGGSGGAVTAVAPGGGRPPAGGNVNPPGGNVPNDAVAAGGSGQNKGGAAAAPAQPPRPGAPAPSSGGQFGLEDDSSVVELQIFGIITIYESPDAHKKAGTMAAADSNPPKQ
jgi:hypothetical protein